MFLFSIDFFAFVKNFKQPLYNINVNSPGDAVVTLFCLYAFDALDCADKNTTPFDETYIHNYSTTYLEKIRYFFLS